MNTIVALLVFQTVWLVPESLSVDGTTKPIHATRTDGGWKFSDGEKEYRIEASQNRYSLSPPDNLSLVFSAPDGVRPVRIGGDRKVFCVAIGELQESPANALLFPDGKVWSFGDALGAIWSRGSRVYVRTDFSPSVATLTIFESRPKTAPRLIPENADPLAVALARFVDRFGGAPHASPAPVVEYPETEDRALPFCVLASLSAGIVDVSAESWNILRGRTGSALPNVARLEAYPPHRLPETIAVHVGQADKSYVALVVFNIWDRMRSLTLSPEDIGLRPGSYIAFDALRVRNLGVFAGDLIVSVPAQTCRVILLRRFEDRPQIVGTDAHIAGEAMILGSESWNELENTLTVSARAPNSHPFNIFISNASSERIYEDPTVETANGSASAHMNNGFYRIELQGKAGQMITARIRFQREQPYPETKLAEISATAATPWAAAFTIQGPHPFPNAGFYIMKNDRMLGYTADPIFSDEQMTPLAQYSYITIPVSFVGAPGTARFLSLNPGWPNDSALHRTPSASFGPDLVPPRVNADLRGKPFVLDGRPAAGISIAAGGFAEWILSRAYASLEGATLRLTGEGRIRILLDGEPVWTESETPSQRFTVDLSQAHRLRIEALDGDAAVINAMLRAKPRP